MKKILQGLLFLISFIATAQTIPPDATQLENIQITNNTTSTTATKMVVQENSGVLNTMAFSPQDNIFISKNIYYNPASRHDNGYFAGLLNTSPSFSLNEKNNLVIVATRNPIYSIGVGEAETTYKYILLNKGKGTYGTGGIVITAQDLELVSVTQTSSADIENNPSTQTINTGANISGTNISAYVNSITPAIAVQSQSQGYVLFKVLNGTTPQTYLFLANGGTYGAGATQTTLADFQLLEEEPSGDLIDSCGINLFSQEDVTPSSYVDFTNGNLYPVDGFSTSLPIDVEENKYYKFSNPQSVAFYDNSGVFISGLNLSLNPTDYFKTPAGTKTLIVTVGNVYLDTYSISLYCGIVKTVITATRNANDWNSIRDIANSITDSSEKNQYEIYVPDGVWEETDWQGWGEWISVRGQSREGTQIYTNGVSTNPTHTIPEGYPFGHVGQQISTVDKQEKHVLFITKDCHFENLTFTGNIIKYPAHIDDGGFSKATFKNCKFVAYDCNSPIGMGVWGGQEIIFEDYILQREVTTGTGIFYHNWNNQSKPTKTIFKNGFFKGCNQYILVHELGSTQNDLLILENSDTDGAKKIVLGVSTGYPIETPYNIHSFFVNTIIENVEIEENKRPNWERYNYFTKYPFVNDSGDTMSGVLNMNNSPIIYKRNGSNVLFEGLLESAFGGSSLDGVTYIYGDNSHFIATNGVIRFEFSSGENVSFEKLKIPNATASNQALAYGQLGTGWASYSDTVYTLGSPFTIASGVTSTLPNNAGTIINDQLPIGVTSFYNSSTSKITPENNGDYYVVTVRFKAQTDAPSSGYFDFGIDIGGALGVQFKETKIFAKGANKEHDFTIISPLYTKETFLANGGTVKITSVNGNMIVYDISYQIDRTHKAK